MHWLSDTKLTHAWIHDQFLKTATWYSLRIETIFYLDLFLTPVILLKCKTAFDKRKIQHFYSWFLNDIFHTKLEVWVSSKISFAIEIDFGDKFCVITELLPKLPGGGNTLDLRAPLSLGWGQSWTAPPSLFCASLDFQKEAGGEGQWWGAPKVGTSPGSHWPWVCAVSTQWFRANQHWLPHFGHHLSAPFGP